MRVNAEYKLVEGTKMAKGEKEREKKGLSSNNAQPTRLSTEHNRKMI